MSKNKFDLLNQATDALTDQDTLWQFSFYHRICLALCDRFTAEELKPIVTDAIARTNARIKERKEPCASSSQPTNS